MPTLTSATANDPIPGRTSGNQGRTLTLAVGATIFLGAFLLFQVQPIIAKAILPRFGGSAAVWTACMLFFQGMLLAGYLYAHASISFLRPVWQRRVHVTLLLIAVAALPITPGPASEALARMDPSLAIAATLMMCVGLPYFMLSTTGPLLQAWVTQLRPGAVPYRLFALSNLASLLGLLTYPVAVEPFVSVRLQSWSWSGAFVAFALLCAFVALRRPSEAAAQAGEARTPSAAPGLGTWLLWLALAACPSVLLLAITNHLTQDIAPVPFLWVAPLALYLLSFILCFEQRSYYKRAVFIPLAAVALVVVDHLLVTTYASDTTVQLKTPLFLLGLFVCCMACHGELARSKPAPDRLTAFYLAVSAGGVLGGVLVGVVAPRVFNDYHELPLALVLTGACIFWAVVRGRGAGTPGYARKATWVALSIVPLFLSWQFVDRARSKVASTDVVTRNFFGTLKVRKVGDGDARYVSIVHGGTEHGGQFTAPERRAQPTAYYPPESGVGLAILDDQARRASTSKVGVIGLGAGTLAAYARPGDEYVFYDINPDVARIARSDFSYLRDAKGAIDLVMGDARVSLENEATRQFDVLVVDAFSSDSIPVHLVTAEAFAEYFRHLKPDGVLAVHTSNRYLELDPVVKAAADHFGRSSVVVENAAAAVRQVNAASWVLVARPGHPLLDKLAREHAAKQPPATSTRLWTDDYSSVVSVVRALQGGGN